MSNELIEKELERRNTDQEDIQAQTTLTNIQKKYIVFGVLGAVIILALIIWATSYLLNASNEQFTSQIRDVFIIFLALESMVMGIALVVLIIQLANLINLLNNELRPIINSTSETVNTLKGTAKFVSNNLAEPVIKINQYAAMVKRLINPSKK